MVLTSDYNRIDFVLIERVLTDDKTEGIGTKQASIRPRILTVDRLKPTRIDQRVLKRFSTQKPILLPSMRNFRLHILLLTGQKSFSITGLYSAITTSLSV